MSKQMTAKQEQLFEAYKPLALRVAARIGKLSREDAIQEAFCGLALAVHGFDENKGAFGVYARRVIWTKCLEAVYHAGLATNVTGIYEVPMDGTDDDDDKPYDIGEDEDGYEGVEAKDMLKRLLDELNDSERELVLMLVKNKTQQQCACRLEISQPTVHRMIVKIRAKAVTLGWRTSL